MVERDQVSIGAEWTLWDSSPVPSFYRWERKPRPREAWVTLPKDLISLRARTWSQVLGCDSSGFSATLLGHLGPPLLSISPCTRSASGKGVARIFWILCSKETHELQNSNTAQCDALHLRVKLFLRNYNSRGEEEAIEYPLIKYDFIFQSSYSSIICSHACSCYVITLQKIATLVCIGQSYFINRRLPVGIL